MTWRSFVNFVIMKELGQTDTIMRGYKIEALNGAKPGQMIDRAYARMGFDQHHTKRSLIMPHIVTMLLSEGYKSTRSTTVLEQWMREYYVWDRLRTLEIIRWPLRHADDNPLF